jgi:glycosyltransferase involved in cell wall biosynthesis
MKIAHIVDSMEVGGAETLVAQLCRVQREQGHEPSVHAHLRLGSVGEQLRSEGFRVEVHGPAHLPKITRKFFGLFSELRPDVVHCHNPTPTIYSAMAARLTGTRTVISTRHSLVTPPYDLASELKYAIASQFCDWVVGICDATCVNLWNAPMASKRRILRIYNGAVPIDRAPVQQQPPKQGFTLVYVGRLAQIKDHPTLLSAFASALSEVPDLFLWIVGDGDERDALEKLTNSLGISGHVTFWGQQLNVSPYFSGADAFIMSSVSEGLPVSLLQAMSVGLPAIVTDVGGMAEVVRLSQSGILTPVSTPSAMAKAIVHLAQDADDRAQFSKCAVASFQKSFTLEAMADAYMNLYKMNQNQKTAAATSTL